MQFQHVLGAFQLLRLLGHHPFRLAPVVEFLLHLGVGRGKAIGAFLDLFVKVRGELLQFPFKPIPFVSQRVDFRRGRFVCCLGLDEQAVRTVTRPEGDDESHDENTDGAKGGGRGQLADPRLDFVQHGASGRGIRSGTGRGSSLHIVRPGQPVEILAALQVNPGATDDQAAEQHRPEKEQEPDDR